LDKREHAKKLTPSEEISRAQSERVLNLINQRNFEEILKEVSPEQANKLIAQREKELEREIVRGG
jgi:Mg/Co/Ni transporter MgtE